MNLIQACVKYLHH
jgi:hypothetical protein